MKSALVVVALAACSDPGDRCSDGTFTAPGRWCTGPAIVIDGDVTDWAAIPDPGQVCATCTRAGQVVNVRATQTADNALAILIDTVGAPSTGPNVAYAVFLYNVNLPVEVMTIQVEPGVAPTMTINYVAISGLPSSFAFGATGVELAIPLAALPFAGAVTVGAQLETYTNSIGWQPGQDQLPFSTICWDRQSAVCAKS